MQPVLAGCEASCKVATHEPLEFLELLDVILDDVGADHIQLVQLGDGLAVVGDEGVVVLDQRLEILERKSTRLNSSHRL